MTQFSSTLLTYADLYTGGVCNMLEYEQVRCSFEMILVLTILSLRTTVSTARKHHLYHIINEENGDLKRKC